MTERATSCTSMVGRLRLCLLKHPLQSHRSQEALDREWESLGYPSRPDFQKVVSEYGGLEAALKAEGVELLNLPEDDGTGADSVYCHDACVPAEGGVVLCRMAKQARAGEPAATSSFLRSAGVRILGQIGGTGTLEGGDVCWLGPKTVAVGEGYRTNAEGISQFRKILLECGVDEVIPVPLPHWEGEGSCLHLLSIISPLAPQLAVVHSPLMPVPFRQLLLGRGWRLVEAGVGEFDSMATNVLAIAPNRCVMLSGCPVTRQRMEEAGVSVGTFEGADLCLKGAGGPTCLTRPLLRDAI